MISINSVNRINVTLKTPISGTIAERFTKSLDLRTETAGLQKEVFSVQDHVNKIYTRNPKGWARTINMTCASPWNSGGGPRQAGTLITQQHLVCAAHYGLWSGTVRFVAKTGQTFDLAIAGREAIPNSDILVAKLEAPLPSLIKPAMMLPPNAFDFLGTGANIPVLILDQEEKALISNIFNLNSSGILSTMKPSEPRLSFYEDKISGDSGNPIFLVYGDDVIILSHLRYGGAGAGPSYIHYYQQIQNMVMAMGGSNTIPIFDLNAANAVTTVNTTIKDAVPVSATLSQAILESELVEKEAVPLSTAVLKP